MTHTSEQSLAKKLDASKKLVKVGEHYAHYRMPKEPYEVISMGFLEESEEPAVVYKALYGKGLVWIRKLSNFLEKVDYEGKKVTRFRKIKK